MRFLYFTDSHIRGTNPKSRLDDYFSSVKEKFEEIVLLSKEKNIDYVLHGGDLFDRPDVSVSVINEIAPILQRFPVPIYAISGNHDIYGHNPATLHRTMLGLLNALGIVRNLNNQRIILKDQTTTVQLSGSPYVYGLDREENRELYRLKKRAPEADYAIHLVHGFLMDKKFLEQVPHTLVSEITDTLADLTISGHYHYGFPLQEVEGKKFINPGAIVRISNSMIEINRRPKILIIEVIGTECRIEEIFLKSAKPGKEILDRSEIEMHKFKRRELQLFKEKIEQTSDLQKVNFIDLVTEMAKNDDLDREVRDEALKRIALVEEKDGQL